MISKIFFAFIFFSCFILLCLAYPIPFVKNLSNGSLKDFKTPILSDSSIGVEKDLEWEPLLRRSPINLSQNVTLPTNSTIDVISNALLDASKSNLTSLLNSTLINSFPTENSTQNVQRQMLTIKVNSLNLNITPTANQTFNLTSKLIPAISWNGSLDDFLVSGKLANLSYTLFNLTTAPSEPAQNQTVVLPNLNYTTPVDPKLSGTNESQIRPLPWSPKPLNGSLSSQGIDLGEVADLSNLDPTLDWKLVINEDFNKELSPETWTVVNSCTPGQITCFINRTENIKVFNDSLIITPMAELKSKPLQYTSGRVFTEFHWPMNSTKFHLWTDAILPNVDSVVPILRLILNHTIVIDFTSPQITTQDQIILGKPFTSQTRVFKVHLDRSSGEIQFGSTTDFRTVLPILTTEKGDITMSIVLSAVIRTSDVLPNGPLFWFGPSEQKTAKQLYKRQLTDQGLIDIWSVTVYKIKAYYSLA